MPVDKITFFDLISKRTRNRIMEKSHKLGEELIALQIEMAGHDESIVMISDYWHTYTITPVVWEEWQKKAVTRVRSVLRFKKQRAEYEVSMLDLSHGLRVSDRP